MNSTSAGKENPSTLLRWFDSQMVGVIPVVKCPLQTSTQTELVVWDR